MARENFTETVTTIALRIAKKEGQPCDVGWVRAAADAGLLGPCLRLASGVRTLRPSAADKGVKLRAKRREQRGRYPRVRAEASV
jgi:hypothetical protein